MTTIGADETVIQEITIKAPAQRIFEALTNPEQRKEWWGSEGRFQTTHVESDLQVGGKWRMSGTGFGRPFTVKGEYRTVEPPTCSPSPGCHLGTRKQLRRWCGSILMNRTALRPFA